MTRAFMDASVLFSAIASKTGASREMLKRHLRHEVVLVVSDYVTKKVVRNISEDMPERLSAFELLLDLLAFEIANPAREDVEKAAQYVVLKDAPVVAAAVVSSCQYLLTFDRKDLINPPQVSEKSGLKIVTPGSFLQLLKPE